MENSLFHGEIVTSRRTVYTPSPFARENLLYLQEVGSLKAQKPHTSRRDGLNSYLFFIVSAGSGTLEYMGKKHTLEAGDCVFIDCHSRYSHTTKENLWELKWVHFYSHNMFGIYQKYAERGGAAVFRPENLSDFDAVWQYIFDISTGDDYIRDMRINENLSRLLTLLMAESWHPEAITATARKKQNLYDIKEYINAHYKEKITLEMLSQKFFINKFYLTRVFKEQFDISVNGYIMRLRITNAKQLLRFTDKSVEDIGIECGIGPAQYFSRAFKKIEGVSPKEYRQRW